MFSKVLRYGDGPSDAVMLDNAEWLTKLNWIEMLRDIGRHFSVNRMLTMDSVRLRLEREQEMSFIEFNYMVCQAYDFVELSRRVDCRLQMGGSDQWGNIVNGVDLGRRMGTPQLFALTTPLLDDRLGRQDGQDRQGRGLAQRRPVQPVRFLAILAQHRGRRRRQIPEAVHHPADGRDPEARGAAGRARSTKPRRCWRRKPPRCCTARDAANEAAETARHTFEEGAIAETLPTVEIPRGELEAGIGVLAAFVKAGLVASNGEARRQIKGGGLRVNDVAVTRREDGADARRTSRRKASSSCRSARSVTSC